MYNYGILSVDICDVVLRVVLSNHDTFQYSAFSVVSMSADSCPTAQTSLIFHLKYSVLVDVHEQLINELHLHMYMYMCMQ